MTEMEKKLADALDDEVCRIATKAEWRIAVASALQVGREIVPPKGEKE